jgi:amino-acid N-acetyltransferase
VNAGFKLQKPVIGDALHIAALINRFGEKGLLLPRSVNNVYEHLRDFVIAKRGDSLIGCAALHVVWDGLGEIRSLVAAEDERNIGAARALVQFCLRETMQLEIRQVFVLTYETAFFAKFGFSEYPKDKLPQKVWKDCVHCPKFPNCDETAMLLDLASSTNLQQKHGIAGAMVANGLQTNGGLIDKDTRLRNVREDEDKRKLPAT